MLEKLARFLGIAYGTNRDSRRREVSDEPIRTLALSIRVKNGAYVRIVHAGGREERYQAPVAASKLLEKYPRMCVARSGVFKRPHESVLSAEDQLVPGQKYILVPGTTVEKVKRRYSLKGRVNEGKEYERSGWDIDVGGSVGGEDFSEESVCSAKDYYAARDRFSKCFQKKMQKNKKPFVPPIQKPKVFKKLEWEPSLGSIEELSP